MRELWEWGEGERGTKRVTGRGVNRRREKEENEGGI